MRIKCVLRIRAEMGGGGLKIRPFWGIDKAVGHNVNISRQVETLVAANLLILTVYAAGEWH